MAIMICLATVLFIMGIIKFVETSVDAHYSKNSRITDYGCREDFSQRFEDDPWSMFRG